MSTVAEIEAAIEKLPSQEQQQLREWFGQRKQPRASVLQKLRALAGTAKNLPPDLAANHDHYLHGIAKTGAELSRTFSSRFYLSYAEADDMAAAKLR